VYFEFWSVLFCFLTLFYFGGTQGTLWTLIIFSYRNFAYSDHKSDKGTLFVSLQFSSVFFCSFFQTYFNFGGTQGTLWAQIILSYRHFAKSVNGTLFVSLQFWSVFFCFVFKLILILEGHKGHFEHKSFLAKGTLPTLTTSQLMGHLLCASNFEVVYFVFFLSHPF